MAKDITPEDQEYIDSMKLFLEAKEGSIEHSQLLMRQCQERIDMDTKFMDIQERFLKLDQEHLSAASTRLDEFIKERGY